MPECARACITAWELYLYAMGVILLVFAARAVLPGAAYAFRNWVGLRI